MLVWHAALAYDPAGDWWRAIADPPIDVERHRLATWTEDRLFVWGGCVSDGHDSSTKGLDQAVSMTSA